MSVMCEVGSRFSFVLVIKIDSMDCASLDCGPLDAPVRKRSTLI